MSDLKTLTKETLDDAYLAALGFTDIEGPWVASVIVVADDDLNIYWISDEKTRHSRAVSQGIAFAASIVAEHKAGQERAIQVVGTVECVEGPLFELEKVHRTKRGKPIPITPGEILDEGHHWYKLTPTRIELINDEHFGWERKRVL